MDFRFVRASMYALAVSATRECVVPQPPTGFIVTALAENLGGEIIATSSGAPFVEVVDGNKGP
jgi:hypothetical protein